MSDRFKFRAKRLLNDEWIYGSYIRNEDDHRITQWNPFIESYESIKIDPKTVGQSTGLKDKVSSRLLFDDDIVDWWFNDGSIRCEIHWNEPDCKFELYPLDSEKYGHRHDISNRCELSYIGNIYENPDLLDA